MKISAFCLYLVGSLFCVNASSAQAPRTTPAQRRVAAANLQIAADAKNPESYNNLALAYLERAQETASPADEGKAAEAIAAGLRLAPGDYQLQKTQVALHLDQHDFARAQSEATQLSAHSPDDAELRGYLARADIGLGNWQAAEEPAQWALNLVPFNVPALLIAADIRDHYGDHDGALELLQRSLAQTSPTETGEVAAIDNRVAAIEIEQGKFQAASHALNDADSLFPHYPETAKNRQHLPAAAASAGPLTPASHEQVAPAPLSVQTRHVSLTPVVFTPVPAALLIPVATATERAIRNAQSKAQANPKDPAAYASLGAAFFQRARETGDVEDFQQAEQALNKSLALDSTSFAADAAYGSMADVCMGEHRFDDAISYAQKALALGSGDISSFAIVGDGNADMGEYVRAAVAYSRLDISDEAAKKPRNVYVRDSRTSYLKFIAGDTDGAIRLMQSAVVAGTEAQLPAENLAWLYYELGEYETQAGDIGAANNAYLTALTTHPGDYRALAGLGKLRGNQGRYAEAIQLYQSAIAVVPMPIFVAELGDLYAKAGNPAEASKQYALVQYIGLLGHINQVLHNRDLALFYADHGIKLDEALVLAHKEFEVRHDVYTWDALAWAFYKNGKYAEASDAMQNALRPGTRDALLLFHAGMIDAALGQTAQAKESFEQALAINPHFHVLYADEARRQLHQLAAQPGLSASKGLTHVP